MLVRPITDSIVQGIDINGKVVAGGSVRGFVPGTLTPKLIYGAEQGDSGQLSLPLDSRGMARVFLDGPTELRFYGPSRGAGEGVEVAGAARRYRPIDTIVQTPSGPGSSRANSVDSYVDGNAIQEGAGDGAAEASANVFPLMEDQVLETDLVSGKRITIDAKRSFRFRVPNANRNAISFKVQYWLILAAGGFSPSGETEDVDEVAINLYEKSQTLNIAAAQGPGGDPFRYTQEIAVDLLRSVNVLGIDRGSYPAGAKWRLEARLTDIVAANGLGNGLEIRSPNRFVNGDYINLTQANPNVPVPDPGGEYLGAVNAAKNEAQGFAMNIAETRQLIEQSLQRTMDAEERAKGFRDEADAAAEQAGAFRDTSTGSVTALDEFTGVAKVNNGYFKWNADASKIEFVENAAAAANFLDFSDTPNAFTNQARKILRANAAENTLEFADLKFKDMLDTPGTPSSRVAGADVGKGLIYKSDGGVAFGPKLPAADEENPFIRNLKDLDDFDYSTNLLIGAVPVQQPDGTFKLEVIGVPDTSLFIFAIGEQPPAFDDNPPDIPTGWAQSFPGEEIPDGQFLWISVASVSDGAWSRAWGRPFAFATGGPGGNQVSFARGAGIVFTIVEGNTVISIDPAYTATSDRAGFLSPADKAAYDAYEARIATLEARPVGGGGGGLQRYAGALTIAQQATPNDIGSRFVFFENALEADDAELSLSFSAPLQNVDGKRHRFALRGIPSSEDTNLRARGQLTCRPENTGGAGNKDVKVFLDELPRGRNAANRSWELGSVSVAATSTAQIDIPFVSQVIPFRSSFDYAFRFENAFGNYGATEDRVAAEHVVSLEREALELRGPAEFARPYSRVLQLQSGYTTRAMGSSLDERFIDMDFDFDAVDDHGGFGIQQNAGTDRIKLNAIPSVAQGGSETEAEFTGRARVYHFGDAGTMTARLIGLDAQGVERFNKALRAHNLPARAALHEFSIALQTFVEDFRKDYDYKVRLYFRRTGAAVNNNTRFGFAGASADESHGVAWLHADKAAGGGAEFPAGTAGQFLGYDADGTEVVARDLPARREVPAIAGGNQNEGFFLRVVGGVAAWARHAIGSLALLAPAARSRGYLRWTTAADRTPTIDYAPESDFKDFPEVDDLETAPTALGQSVRLVRDWHGEHHGDIFDSGNTNKVRNEARMVMEDGTSPNTIEALAHPDAATRKGSILEGVEFVAGFGGSYQGAMPFYFCWIPDAAARNRPTLSLLAYRSGSADPVEFLFNRGTSAGNFTIGGIPRREYQQRGVPSPAQVGFFKAVRDNSESVRVRVREEDGQRTPINWKDAFIWINRFRSRLRAENVAADVEPPRFDNKAALDASGALSNPGRLYIVNDSTKDATTTELYYILEGRPGTNGRKGQVSLRNEIAWEVYPAGPGGRDGFWITARHPERRQQVGLLPGSEVDPGNLIGGFFFGNRQANTNMQIAAYIDQSYHDGTFSIDARSLNRSQHAAEEQFVLVREEGENNTTDVHIGSDSGPVKTFNNFALTLSDPIQAMFDNGTWAFTDNIFRARLYEVLTAQVQTPYNINPDDWRASSGANRRAATDGRNAQSVRIGVITTDDDGNMQMAQDGADGASIRVAFARGAAAPAVAGTGADTPAGWTLNQVPVGNQPLWLIISTNPGGGAWTDWSAAIPLHGAKGDKGDTGDRYVPIFRTVARDAAAPAVPAFATLAAVANPWSTAQPSATDALDVYESRGRINAAGDRVGNWSAPALTSRLGAEGSSGDHGNHPVAIFRLSARDGAAPATPAFATEAAIADPWSTSQPAATAQMDVYISWGEFNSDDELQGAWSDAVRLARLGADGADGADGDSPTPIFTSAAADPATPTFANRAAVTADADWSFAIPAKGSGERIYRSEALLTDAGALVAGATWTDPLPLEGADGRPGNLADSVLSDNLRPENLRVRTITSETALGTTSGFSDLGTRLVDGRVYMLDFQLRARGGQSPAYGGSRSQVIFRFTGEDDVQEVGDVLTFPVGADGTADDGLPINLAFEQPANGNTQIAYRNEPWQASRIGLRVWLHLDGIYEVRGARGVQGAPGDVFRPIYTASAVAPNIPNFASLAAVDADADWSQDLPVPGAGQRIYKSVALFNSAGFLGQGASWSRPVPETGLDGVGAQAVQPRISRLNALNLPGPVVGQFGAWVELGSFTNLSAVSRFDVQLTETPINTDIRSWLEIQCRRRKAAAPAVYVETDTKSGYTRVQNNAVGLAIVRFDKDIVMGVEGGLIEPTDTIEVRARTMPFVNNHNFGGPADANAGGRIKIIPESGVQGPKGDPAPHDDVSTLRRWIAGNDAVVFDATTDTLQWGPTQFPDQFNHLIDVGLIKAKVNVVVSGVANVQGTFHSWFTGRNEADTDFVTDSPRVEIPAVNGNYSYEFTLNAQTRRNLQFNSNGSNLVFAGAGTATLQVTSVELFADVVRDVSLNDGKLQKRFLTGAVQDIAEIMPLRVTDIQGPRAIPATRFADRAALPNRETIEGLNALTIASLTLTQELIDLFGRGVVFSFLAPTRINFTTSGSESGRFSRSVVTAGYRVKMNRGGSESIFLLNTTGTSGYDGVVLGANARTFLLRGTPLLYNRVFWEETPPRAGDVVSVELFAYWVVKYDSGSYTLSNVSATLEDGGRFALTRYPHGGL